jgi:hypothetical protein
LYEAAMDDACGVSSGGRSPAVAIQTNTLYASSKSVLPM